MPISFQCSNCGATYNVSESMAGKRAKCKCGNPLEVPAGPAPADPTGGWSPINENSAGGGAYPGFQVGAPQQRFDPMAGQQQHPVDQQQYPYQDPSLGMQQPMQQPMQPGMPMQQPNMPMNMGPGTGYPMPRPTNAAGLMLVMAAIMAMVMALDEVYPRGNSLISLFKIVSRVSMSSRLAGSLLGQIGLFAAVIGIAVAGVGLLIGGMSEMSGKPSRSGWARITGMISGFAYIGIRTLFFFFGVYQLISAEANVSLLFNTFTTYVSSMMVPMFLVVVFFARRRG